ncbi:VTT domain-containing protein [Segetibacter sp.]|jgi:membrane-associated protein|uniref:DedA family protein n=1 Tax=Segetibacter sp. TaxID=2231182 RepID=UPI00263867CB|nr:VTT domain-containing protein [Segetibacter sp.]MCW3080347.1 DedA protein [Segetibacter sp.]
MDKGFVQQFIEWIIHNGGLYVLLLVIFAETGLFVGFFLPGDSLLFAAGIYVKDLSKAFYGVHFSVIILLVIVASILGNMVGYWFGYKYGSQLFTRKDSFLFRKKHLLKAKDFYEKYGKATIFIAKFLPILRTFAPIVAGIVKMEKPAFTLFNVLGSVAWVLSMMLGGYYLQQWVETQFHFSLKDHIEAIALVIILITTLPVLFKLFFGKKDDGIAAAEELVKDMGKDKKLL